MTRCISKCIVVQNAKLVLLEIFVDSGFSVHVLDHGI